MVSHGFHRRVIVGRGAARFRVFTKGVAMSANIKVGRNELVEALAKKSGLSQAKSNDLINILVEEIQNNVKKGKDVTIVGFGTFTSRKRAARVGRNPKTGEALKIKASVAPAFRAGAKFKAAVAK